MQVQVSVQTDKKKPQNEQNSNKNNLLIPQINQQQQYNKQRKIKKLTMINKQLIQILKQQNQQLTKKINKQKYHPNNRSFSVHNQSIGKQTQSIKRQLINVYKQIDMYKNILQDMKAKQISIDSVDKINQLENKVKIQQNIIQNLQKQIKYISNIRDQQAKEVKILENDQVKTSVTQLEAEAQRLRQKFKGLKKTLQKRQQAQKKHQGYQIELQKALRKQCNQYYPGKVQKKAQKTQYDISMYTNVSEKQWQTVKIQLEQLRLTHQEVNKKIQLLYRIKAKQLKSAEENQLKIKEKSRKLDTLKNKIMEISKLVMVKNNKNSDDQQDQDNMQGQYSGKGLRTTRKGYQSSKNADLQRSVKRWVIPNGYCLQQGKILPDSIFFSDKSVLKSSKKSKIKTINIWTYGSNIPSAFQFLYKNQNQKVIEGVKPPNLSPDLSLTEWDLKQGDYLAKLHGQFTENQLITITFISKFGRQIKFGNPYSQPGIPFKFQPRPNQIPSCFFGAYCQKNNNSIVCHIGCQFIADW